MKITELLDNILHKRYGKDVRQNIHDAIKQCYDDATGNPDSVAKVVDILNKTPRTTGEEYEELELPVHTINDSATNTTSTWSSEKTSKEIKAVISDKKIDTALVWSSEKTSSEIIQNTRNVTDFKSYDNNIKIQYEAFELGKKIGVELYHMDYDYYSGSISKNERYGIALSTRKKYSHAPFFFVSVSGVSEANDGVYGDISASVSGVKENTDKTYDFYVYLSNASTVAKKPGVYVMCLGMIA